MNDQTTIEAFKGFGKDFKCLGFQFEVGKEYKHEGQVCLCHSGFHACEYPFDVFRYYPISAGSQYASVTLGRVSAQKESDSKRAAGYIKINAKLSLPDLIEAQVSITKERAGKENMATGYRGHAAATGYCGHAAATGDYGHAAATGYRGHAAATGGSGCAFAGFGGRAKCGETGSFAIAWLDGDTGQARIFVGKPGEDGIKADTFYEVRNGALVEAAVK